MTVKVSLCDRAVEPPTLEWSGYEMDQIGANFLATPTSGIVGYAPSLLAILLLEA